MITLNNTYKYRLLGKLNFIFTCKLLIYNKSYIIRRFCQNLTREKGVCLHYFSFFNHYLTFSLTSETTIYACLRLH